MQTKVAQGIIAREGRTYLDVPHQKGILSFVSPEFGPDFYVNVASQINEARLTQPIMEQNASLVHAAWQNPKEKYSAQVINLMKNNLLWGFNGLLWMPQEGVYIQDRPEIKAGTVIMNREDLVAKLEAKDPAVRFVPFGFKTEYQTSRELEKNEFVKALAGEEGAQKLAEVADKYNGKPYVAAFTKDSIKEPTMRVARLDSDWGLDGGRLSVGGGWVDYRFGYAFGVHAPSVQKI